LCSGDLSTNNWVIGLLAGGEGWHNNHHAFQWSAAHGLDWWEFDACYCGIRLLAAVGLAWDVQVPTQQQRAAKRKQCART
jgi:stearoyl-CoA desaturase (delta-9 desaturase)